MRKGRTIPARVETVVIYLPDVRSCVPTRLEWDDLNVSYRQKLDHVIKHPPVADVAVTTAAGDSKKSPATASGAKITSSSLTGSSGSAAANVGGGVAGAGDGEDVEAGDEEETSAEQTDDQADAAHEKAHIRFSLSLSHPLYVYLSYYLSLSLSHSQFLFLTKKNTRNTSSL